MPGDVPACSLRKRPAQRVHPVPAGRQEHDHVTELVRRWRRMPVTHLMVNVRSRDPIVDLRRLAQA